MRRLVTPGRLAAVGLVLLAALALVVWVAPADSYLILPDRAKPLAERVEVPGGKADKDGGGIYFVDVIVRKASVLEERVARFRPDGAELVPEHAIVPPGSNFEDRRRENLRAMSRSQKIAAAVALRELGYDVAGPEGARVVAVQEGAPADGVLETKDVIVGVDGKPVRTPEDLRRLIATREIGDPVRLRVRRGGTTRTLQVKTVESPVEEGRPIVGVQVEQFSRPIQLPLDIEIDLGRIGGPSAGLAFALQILEELGEEVDRGNRVAATGEIQLDGDVAPVGGLKQKTIGARRAGADVFLVPAGENAAVARANAAGLRIIPVHNFQQALRALKTLPRN